MGARTMDLASLNWMTPDPNPGSLSSPLSLKPYPFASNNPLLYADPSGQDGGVIYTGNGSNSGSTVFIIPIVGAIVGAIGGWFSGLFGGHHHSSSPPPPPQAQAIPEDFNEEDVQAFRALAFTEKTGTALLNAGNLALIAVATDGLGAVAGVGVAGAEGAADVTIGAVVESTSAGLGPAEAGVTVFRVAGGKTGFFGRYWTRVNPRTVENYRNLAGLPPSNSGEYLIEATLLDLEGVTWTEEGAASLAGNAGGIDELIIPNPAWQVRINTISNLKPPL
jgi:hypothetical protein